MPYLTETLAAGWARRKERHPVAWCFAVSVAIMGVLTALYVTGAGAWLMDLPGKTLAAGNRFNLTHPEISCWLGGLALLTGLGVLFSDKTSRHAQNMACLFCMWGALVLLSVAFSTFTDNSRSRTAGYSAEMQVLELAIALEDARLVPGIQPAFECKHASAAQHLDLPGKGPEFQTCEQDSQTGQIGYQVRHLNQIDLASLAPCTRYACGPELQAALNSKGDAIVLRWEGMSKATCERMAEQFFIRQDPQPHSWSSSTANPQINGWPRTSPAACKRGLRNEISMEWRPAWLSPTLAHGLDGRTR